jgi:flagellar protein FlbD
MIEVKRMDRQLMYLNPDHIISIEETPDTVISLYNGNRYIVLERAAVIIQRIVTFRAGIIRRAGSNSPRKYLVRNRTAAFRRVMIDEESPAPGKPGNNEQTLFHSRDN